MGQMLPTYKYSSRQSVVSEAERLARLHRGQKFFVLASTDCTVVDDMVRTTFTVDPNEIPF